MTKANVSFGNRFINQKLVEISFLQNKNKFRSSPITIHQNKYLQS